MRGAARIPMTVFRGFMVFALVGLPMAVRAMKIQMPIMINKELSAFRIHSQSKGGRSDEEQFDEELEVAKRFQ